jgi:hypothetical protein
MSNFDLPKRLREAIIAMAEDGWLICGPEGMSEAQEKLYMAYMLLTERKPK